MILLISALLVVISSYTAHAEQACMDTKELTVHLLSDKATLAEKDNLAKQIKLYIKNESNYKEQISNQKNIISLQNEEIQEQKKLLVSAEELSEKQQNAVKEIAQLLDEARQESWLKNGMWLGTGATLGVLARGAWVKWVRW